MNLLAPRMCQSASFTVNFFNTIIIVTARAHKRKYFSRCETIRPFSRFHTARRWWARHVLSILLGLCSVPTNWHNEYRTMKMEDNNAKYKQITLLHKSMSATQNDSIHTYFPKYVNIGAAIVRRCSPRAQGAMHIVSLSLARTLLLCSLSLIPTHFFMVLCFCCIIKIKQTIFSLLTVCNWIAFCDVRTCIASDKMPTSRLRAKRQHGNESSRASVIEPTEVTSVIVTCSVFCVKIRVENFEKQSSPTKVLHVFRVYCAIVELISPKTVGLRDFVEKLSLIAD